MKKYFVTYKTTRIDSFVNNLPVFKRVSHAIECPDEKAMMDCARDMYSYDGVMYIRLNRSGKLTKGTKIHSYKAYKDSLLEILN